ncbi:MAG TPA: hypothetical protein DC035_02745 [Lachnospiraceae bacterium]|nr:hypothetical protein [Lachnospiraceae bacterium]
MERLTENKRNSDGTGVSKQSLIDRPGKGYPSNYARYIVTRLAELEDLEEQGLLLRLPCKVGDTLYCITPYVKEPIIEAHVLQMNIKQFYNKRIIVRIDVMNKMGESCYFLDDIGKKIFLSREEAEAKLAEMEGAE